MLIIKSAACKREHLGVADLLYTIKYHKIQYFMGLDLAESSNPGLVVGCF